MAEVFDYISDETGDLKIREGDFFVAESTQQHQEDLLTADKGQYKIFPTVGVGINRYLNEDLGYRELECVINTEFKNDGMNVAKLEVINFENVNINAEYLNDENPQQNTVSRR